MTEQAYSEVFVGDNPIRQENLVSEGEFVQIWGEPYYAIRHYDRMPPFFMSLVSSGDHWLFISSSGGLTAGRRNSDSALFPYETEDKVTAHSDLTGSKTILRVNREGRELLWEPFSSRYAGVYRCERHLYKNLYGNKLIFEEINHDLQLTLRYGWRTGDRFGFIKSSWLSNDGEAACTVALLDGFQNLLPYGATTELQTSLSSLLDGYKRNELDEGSGLGIFALSATLTDRAEPSESLQATVAWQTGLDGPITLLSADQLDRFRYGLPLIPEQDLRGKAGSYLVSTRITLQPAQMHRWHIVADVNQDSADVAGLINLLDAESDSVERMVEEDIDRNTNALVGFVAAADGIQQSAHPTIGAHHFANVLFNIMRGGIFANGYQVGKVDLLAFVLVRNRAVFEREASWFEALPTALSIQELYDRASDSGSADLVRLCYEYLPLTFSRRHGDPSRPWNRFSINLRNEDGSPRLDYQGNWRDIFQNWEPLALSFPGYAVGMVAKFLNATTADGYNPYRVTRDGIEWEVPEPDNPWANIGYWSDHQIIYLLKLLELVDSIDPDTLASLWNRPIFAHANVPYRLRPYREMLADWYNTIEFDHEEEARIQAEIEKTGSDARLLCDDAGQVVHVTMQEKLLTLLLAKVTNLVPEGGIWMNTQRPEWNDANNALVGKGLSVVTAAYLRRFVVFWQTQISGREEEVFSLNPATADLLHQVETILSSHRETLDRGFDSETRRAIMDQLGEVADGYRSRLYADGLPTEQVTITGETLHDFLALVRDYIEQTLRTNRRDDGLYHAYNVMRLEENATAVDSLYPMLEGQVAILSSGLLEADEVAELLERLRQSPLYREDQHSYMLYPDRELPGFFIKNHIDPGDVSDSDLVAKLDAAGDTQLLIQDVNGDYHFNGSFRNADNVARVLDTLARDPEFSNVVAEERDQILDLFEKTFQHAAFTGRSGTFFAYEGLGSIYWHMVAKLLLAVQECYQSALAAGDEKNTAALTGAYYDIRSGLGFNKSPAVYGAFPTDPYSHTPGGGGARQPGMTGQVKEEILTRWGELGVSVRRGRLCFEPTLLKAEEFSTQSGSFHYVDLTGRRAELPLAPNSLAFTFCQTPVVYSLGSEPGIVVTYTDGEEHAVTGPMLDESTSRQLFARTGQIKLIRVSVE